MFGKKVYLIVMHQNNTKKVTKYIKFQNNKEENSTEVLYSFCYLCTLKE